MKPKFNKKFKVAGKEVTVKVFNNSVSVLFGKEFVSFNPSLKGTGMSEVDTSSLLFNVFGEVHKLVEE